MTVAEVSALARAQPVLAKTILLRVGVELHRPPRQVLALPWLDGRWAVGAAADTGERHRGDQEKTEPHGDQTHAVLLSRRVPPEDAP